MITIQTLEVIEISEVSSQKNLINLLQDMLSSFGSMAKVKGICPKCQLYLMIEHINSD